MRQWADTTIRRVSREWKVRGGVMEKVTQLLVTPRVVREVRSHFGCPTLEGAELEDQGGDGTALTHWEKRIFQVNIFRYTWKSLKIYFKVSIFEFSRTRR